jgi:hypothetical protein
MADFGPTSGGDTVDSLLIDVRASTQGFSEDLAAMRGTLDSTLVDGFSRAGNVLEHGLLGAIRKGSLGFDDLRRVAMNVINDIAAQAVGNLFSSIGGGTGAGGGGLLGGIGGIVGSILGLPGRATGGIVSPGRGFLVGERGPELFVPTSAGSIERYGAGSGGREVRVSINVVTPAGSSAPQALQRSSRQVASAVRRALTSS